MNDSKWMLNETRTYLHKTIILNSKDYNNFETKPKVLFK